MRNPDLAFTFLCAIRYAMGRRSYAPSVVARTVANHSDVFGHYELANIVREIEDAGDLGDPCDVATWYDLAGTLRAEIARRAGS